MGELYNPYPKLPKNIRQIGERDEVVRLYLEDYVNTYLKRLYPQGGQDLRVGLLLGSSEVQDGTPYIFIDGAMEMEGVTEEGEKVAFTEAAWKRAYQSMEETFPKRTVQGWFLCGGQGSQLSPLNYWKQHIQYFSGKNQLMYLNSGMEGEEAIYMTSEDGFYRLKGHSIYYERNQMMQDYMILRKDAHRVESGTNDRITRDFRNKMQDRKIEVLKKRSKVNLLGGACGALSLALLAGGVVMFNNYNKMKEMEAVLVSVLPSGYEEWYENDIGAEDGGLLIEEAAGGVETTGAAQAGGGQAGDGQAGTYGDAGASWTYEETEMGPEEGAEVSEETPAETSGGPVESASGGQAGVSGDQTAAQTESSEAERATEIIGETMVQGGNATAGKDYMTPAPEAAGDDMPGAGSSGSSSVTGGSGSTSGADGAASGAGSSAPASESTASAPAGQTASDEPVTEVNAQGQRIYTIKEGETLHGICYKFYHTINRLDDLCEANQIEDVDRIISGKTLIIPE